MTTYRYIPEISNEKLLSDNLQEIFDCELLNNKIPYFNEAEINFQRFLEQIELTEREKDLIYITNFFSMTFNELRRKLMLNEEPLPELIQDRMKRVYKLLYKLNLLKLLFNNKEDDIIDYDQFCELISK